MQVIVTLLRHVEIIFKIYEKLPYPRDKFRSVFGKSFYSLFGGWPHSKKIINYEPTVEPKQHIVASKFSRLCHDFEPHNRFSMVSNHTLSSFLVLKRFLNNNNRLLNFITPLEKYCVWCFLGSWCL